MSLAQTNEMSRTAAWSSYSAATASSREDGPEQPEEDSLRPFPWPEPVALVILKPAVTWSAIEAMRRTDSRFATYDMGGDIRQRYQVIDLERLLPIEGPDAMEDEVPVFSFPAKSRITVTAKVQVRPMRLSLVMPEELLEEE